MSVSSSLQASARAAYRELLRAASVTFAGDALVQNAFKLKMRSEVIPNASVTDPQAFTEKVTLAKEIADVLRRNVVQARKAENREAWEINITKDTELGDNESIKNPPPMQSGRKRTNTSVDNEHNNEDTSSAPAVSAVPRYYSQLKKAHKDRQVPEIREEDLEESFVRGSGPGGQSINKTENNVQLLHKPTGIRVTCQQTRSLAENRHIARKILRDKLDKLYNPGLSKQEMQRAKQIERERRRRKKAKKRNKEREDKKSTSADD
ncbi:RF-1 domain-containing protein [Irpex rosettiformis]|uniref:RF-1 domain-containing protein n=1 Tax=Irpex rosettiformis TaxID=378272 RepID=A0ACB8TXQ4_9APHY|nr:RF-1 domain-containing protein [Irpex rosettiformis]